MVRPIDAQLAIIQTTTVERVQQAQQRHPGVQQQYFETRLQQERELQRERVQETEKTEMRGIGQEGGSASNFQQESKAEEKTEKAGSGDQSGGPVELDGRGSLVNIKV